MDSHTTELLILVLSSAAATYVWRGLGVLFSGRIRTDSELFQWVACVAYAMVAGLIMRIIVMPTGMLATSMLADRLIACALALLGFYISRKNLFVGVITGVAVVVAAGYVRGI
ncbi:MAG: AzlD domain-containing protein [Burkholderiales bacterium]|nr:AzlD domain-containing protein [Burkholderiales bacterium]